MGRGKGSADLVPLFLEINTVGSKERYQFKSPDLAEGEAGRVETRHPRGRCLVSTLKSAPSSRQRRLLGPASLGADSPRPDFGGRSDIPLAGGIVECGRACQKRPANPDEGLNPDEITGHLRASVVTEL